MRLVGLADLGFISHLRIYEWIIRATLTSVVGWQFLIWSELVKLAIYSISQMRRLLVFNQSLNGVNLMFYSLGTADLLLTFINLLWVGLKIGLIGYLTWYHMVCKQFGLRTFDLSPSSHGPTLWMIGHKAGDDHLLSWTSRLLSGDLEELHCCPHVNVDQIWFVIRLFDFQFGLIINSEASLRG